MVERTFAARLLTVYGPEAAWPELVRKLTEHAQVSPSTLVDRVETANPVQVTRKWSEPSPIDRMPTKLQRAYYRAGISGIDR
jgi:hypothetical protein